MKNVALPYAVMHYEDPIVSIVFKEKSQLGFLEMREMNRYAEKLSGGRSYFRLCYLPEEINITPLGKQVVANTREAPLCKASAIIANKNNIDRTKKFFYKIKKARSMFRTFANGQEAREWLLDQKDDLDRYNEAV